MDEPKRWPDKRKGGRRKPMPVLLKACDSHKVVKRGYNAWHDWAQKLNNQGIRQRQCPVCGHWLFPDEM